jgi:ureidoglycolate lyase
MAEPQIKKVKIEPLTEEAFRPFGEVLGPKEISPSAVSPSGGTAWFSGFSVDGEALVAFNTKPYSKPPTEFLCYQLEQHRDVTQSMVPLEGKPGVVLVAPPTPWRSQPDIDSFRAFLLDGTRGVVMSKLTWHMSGLDGATSFFPLYPPVLNSIVIHGKEVWNDVVAEGGELTHHVNLKDAFDTVIQLTW